MKSDDIISYRDMCSAENVGTLQRGMNYRLHPTHSVLLMSTRQNAPYHDMIKDNGLTLIYEGHDINNTADIDNPKHYDQPMYTKTGKLTQNGKFFKAAIGYQNGERLPELVHVYEKIKPGIWVFNGKFNLVDAQKKKMDGRIVFKFKLQAENNQTINVHDDPSENGLEHTRIIPSVVKIEVWKRDRGRCTNCGNNTNLQFDHIIPYARGGTSLSTKNIQLLCMSCNLTKSDNIL